MNYQLSSKDIKKIYETYTKMVQDRSGFVTIMNKLMGNTNYIEENIHVEFNTIMSVEPEIKSQDVHELLKFNLPTLLNILKLFPDWDIVGILKSDFDKLTSKEKNKFSQCYSILVMKNIININKENEDFYTNILYTLFNRTGYHFYEENENILTYIIENDFDDELLTDLFVLYVKNNHDLINTHRTEFKDITNYMRDFDFSNYEDVESVYEVFRRISSEESKKENIARQFTIDLSQVIDNTGIKTLQDKYVVGVKKLVVFLNQDKNIISKTYSYKDPKIKFVLKLKEEDNDLFEKVRMYLVTLKDYKFVVGAENYKNIWDNAKLYVNLNKLEIKNPMVKTKKVKI